MKAVLVVNPMSGGGRTSRRLAELERLALEVLEDAVVRPTASHGDGRRLAREAVEGGADVVIAVGGDGTASEVVDGVVAGGGGCFGLVPAGTGSDLARTLRVPSDWRRALEGIRDAEPVAVDTMRGRFKARDGGWVERVGVNVIGIGMAGDVVFRVNASRKRLGGRVSFLLATLRSLVAWRPPEVRLAWEEADGAERTWEGPLVNLFVANGRYCGGGMNVAPDASMSDGLLDLTLIPAQSLTTLAKQTPRLYDGSLTAAPGVVTARARRVTAVVGPGVVVPCDTDGESPGYLPAEITCIPNAVSVRAPWQARVSPT